MAASEMITSKDIIEKAGISRATLNNYIKFGILPRPIVGPPKDNEKGVKQIGFFPVEVLEHIDKVRELKRRGRSMDEIAAYFQSERDHSDDRNEYSSSQPGPSVSIPSGEPSSCRVNDRNLKVTICDISTPAYLVNPSFEIEWINTQAEELIFGSKVSRVVDCESRNVFKMFLEELPTERGEEWEQLVSTHLTVFQKSLRDSNMQLYRGISVQESAMLSEIFRSRKISRPQQIYRIPLTLVHPGNIAKSYLVYTMTFREGTFFVYIPDEGIGSDLMSMLGQRERVINELLKHRMPSLVSLCVLFADLQDSMRISAELLPGQYFELINGLWECLGPVFEKYRGVYGKHVGDGVLYYFLEKPGENYITNSINCALDINEIVFEFSEKWKERKGWDNDLYLNTGINEGQEFFGTIRAADTIEFTALGDTINTAARLSEFARDGQIWTTKNLISKLTQEERDLLRFGVHKNNNPANRFVRDSFSRVADLVQEENLHYRHFCTIAGLPITEIKERIKPVSVG